MIVFHDAVVSTRELSYKIETAETSPRAALTVHRKERAIVDMIARLAVSSLTVGARAAPAVLRAAG